jgi:hypothetical protein
MNAYECLKRALSGQISGVACSILILLGACASSAPRTHPRSEAEAVVSRIEGKAEISRASGSWTPAHLGETLHEDDQARTGAGAKLDLNLGNLGGVLTLMPESLLRFEQLSPPSPGADILAILDLRQGRVVGDTLKLPQGKKILIRTRAGTYEIP